MDQINTGKCNDLVVSELVVAVSELADPAEKELILTNLKDIALKSGNPASVAASIRALVAFQPMEDGLENSIEIRILEMITSKVAFSSRTLQEAIAEFLYLRVSERVDHAAPFVDTLIQFLDERSGTGGTTAYNTLMIVAANRPEYFQQYAGLLIKMLGSINKATRVQTTRLIAVLAMSHPEYVASAEKTLLHISSFNPDGELKNSASEALQILQSQLRQSELTPIDEMTRQRQEPDSQGGLADIMRRSMGKDKKVPNESGINRKLLSLATNFARKADRAYKTDGDGAEIEETDTEAINKIMDDFSDIAQSIKAESVPAVKAEGAEAAHLHLHDSQEEVELRRVMDKVKDDFSINAGNILDAIGMSHLAKEAMMDEASPRPAEVPVRDGPKRVRLTRTEPALHEQVRENPPPKKMVEEEEDVSPKEFIASIESIISRTENENADLTPVGENSDITDGPLAPLTDAEGSGNAAADSAVAASDPVPETETPGPVIADMTALPEAQPERPRPVKSPIVPSGVRISAMKFKSIDQSKSKKTPTPPKISIKPHIRPLGKTPDEGAKIAQVRQHPMSTTPLAPRGLVPKASASPGEVVCHSCNAKMPDDSQRCAICGSDLKAPKVRCRICGEINLRGSGKCNRCGSGIDE